jgi:hypothetical protein
VYEAVFAVYFNVLKAAKHEKQVCMHAQCDVEMICALWLQK